MLGTRNKWFRISDIALRFSPARGPFLKHLPEQFFTQTDRLHGRRNTHDDLFRVPRGVTTVYKPISGIQKPRFRCRRKILGGHLGSSFHVDLRIGSAGPTIRWIVATQGPCWDVRGLSPRPPSSAHRKPPGRNWSTVSQRCTMPRVRPRASPKPAPPTGSWSEAASQ